MRGISIKRLLLTLLGVCVLVVVVLNWTYGRLPAAPHPTGSFVQLAGGLRLHYIERPGTEPAVLLIHGLPGTAEDWNLVTRLLRGRRTVAIDRPGFGFSSGGYFAEDRQLGAIEELTVRLHLGRPILVGHSYGGTLSLAFAERHPGNVRGLVLVDAAAGGCQHHSETGAAEVRLLQAMELPVVNQLANATFSQLLLKRTAEQVDSEAFAPGPVAPAHLHRALAINMKRGNLQAWAGESLVALKVIERVNRGLRSILTPTVVIEGEHDSFVKPQCAKQLAAILPRARLEMVSGGHMAPYTHPATIATAVEARASSSR